MIDNNSFYSQKELETIGFSSIGEGCLISRNAKFYTPSTISLGNCVRIDDFCILSGNIECGNDIHISAYVVLYGAERIILEDNTGISARTTIYSTMDDFSGDFLIGPMSSEGTRHVTGGPVLLRRYSQIGAHCVVFPNITIGTGSIVGACSLVKHSLDEWGIYAGCPAHFMKNRKKGLLALINK